MKQKKQEWVQQKHKGCRGDIAVVYDGNTYGFVCLRCKDLWGIAEDKINKVPEWVDYNKHTGHHVEFLARACPLS